MVDAIIAGAVVVLAFDAVFLLSYVVNGREAMGFYDVSRERRPWWAR